MNMLSSLTWVDDIILVMFFLSVLAGLMRGFVKEVLSVVTWVAAIFVAVMFSSKLSAVFTGSQQVQSVVTSASSSMGMSAAQPVSVLSIGISFILLFVGTMIIGSLITSIVSSAVEVGGIGLINRLLGSIFGLLRGFLVVLVAMFLLQLTSVGQEPWWQQSTFVNSFQPAVQWVGNMISPGLTTLKNSVSSTLQNANPSQYIHNLTGH